MFAGSCCHILGRFYGCGAERARPEFFVVMSAAPGLVVIELCAVLKAVCSGSASVECRRCRVFRE